MEGCGTFVWPDGSRYVGAFHGGFVAGQGKITFADGSTLEGNMKWDGGVDGIATYTETSGEKIVGPARDVTADLSQPRKSIDYPFWRAFFGDRADVYVLFVLDRAGYVRSAALLKSIDSPSYTNAALDAIKAWRYLPATINGRPIPSMWIIHIQFTEPN